MNISIKILNTKGEIISQKILRYSDIKKMKQITIPFGEYIIVLEIDSYSKVAYLMEKNDEVRKE